LLQNENGPCPLLAATNALLLRGVVNLPSTCVRSNVASIEEVVTLLANWALTRSDGIHGNEEENDELRRQQSQYGIDELLKLLPKLQYGMDINPKFTCSPEGCEYTDGVAAFDILGVKLIHGWLVDPQDKVICELIGNRSYNELVEFVIKGSDASLKLKKLKDRDKNSDEKSSHCKSKQENDNNINSQLEIEQNKNVDDQSKPEAEHHISVNDPSQEEQDKKANEQSELNQDIKNDCLSDPDEDKNTFEQSEEQEEDKKSSDTYMHDLSKCIDDANIIQSFLNETSHQLTYYGLHILHSHIKNDTVCVFFRNNHFSTLLKHNEVLYLLVTDLGYADVEDVIWERLENIDGDTDYVDCFFQITKPREAATEVGSPSPDFLLAQRGQVTSDYQLALQAQYEADTAVAKVESLKTTNNLETIASIPPNLNNPTETSKLSSKLLDSGGNASSDHAYALALQAQYEADTASEQLARRLQYEENKKSPSPTTKSNDTKENSRCIIS